MRNTIHRSRLSLLSALLVVFLASGCMNTRVVAKYDSDNPVPHQVVKWNYFWGLVQPNDVKTDETCESICKVNVKNNIGYILISGATLGIVVPTSIEYECCPYIPDPGGL